MRHFADRLIEQIEKVGNYGCLGIDPRPEWDPDPDHDFALELGGMAKGRLPAIKPQAAFLGDDKERVDTLCVQARRDGVLSIADVKRGDIGTTAEAYAEAWLTSSRNSVWPRGPDAITVNPYLGMDSLEPFVKVAAREGRGIFVLVRTSNHGANDIQDRRLDTGVTVSEEVAMMVHRLGEKHVGARGYSLVGAVVGATVPAPLVARLRQLMPRTIFLMPGLGAQGGKHESVQAALDKDGLGVLAPSSRSLNYPWKDKEGRGSPPEGWRPAIQKAIEDFAASLPVLAARA